MEELRMTTTPEGWHPEEFEATTKDGVVFSWGPEIQEPYRVIGLRICTPRKVTLVSAEIGGGMSLLTPITSNGAVSIQDAERKSSPRSVVIDATHRAIELEPGDWIVEPFFQHPLLLKPNKITIKLDHGVHHHPAVQKAVPRVFARFIAPDNGFTQVSAEQVL